MIIVRGILGRWRHVEHEHLANIYERFLSDGAMTIYNERVVCPFA